MSLSTVAASVTVRAGFRSPETVRPRAAAPQWFAASFFELPVLGGSNGRGASPCRLSAPHGPGLRTRSSCRPHFAVGVAVVANLTVLEALNGKP